MRQPSPRLGYYIISVGTILEFLGLVGDSWSGGGSQGRTDILSFSQPGDVLLVVGLAITVLGTVLGLLSLSRELSQDVERQPRLLPAMPLVLLVGVSIGSVAFAYQAGNSSSGAAASVSAQAAPPSVTATATPFCPPGTFWLATTQQCLSLTVDANGVAQAATPLAPGETPVCPAGTIWHPANKHCMLTTCPPGYVFNAALFVCDFALPATPGLSTGPAPTPVCPNGTFWHPVMSHCMSTVCPVGYEWSWSALTCLQLGATPTLEPGTTPTSPPGVSPTPTAAPTPTCPDGYFWHPAMGHCMSNTCPPPLVFNYTTLFCELPSTGTPSATSTPSPSPTPTAASVTPAPVSTPTCPDGYFWHPAMGHCMSNTCPPGLVFDPVTLYCVLPTPSPTPG